MFAIVTSIALIAFILSFIYARPVYLRILEKRERINFEKQISLMSELYKDCVLIKTSKLGTGLSANTSIRFEQAHIHQKEAIEATKGLVKIMGA